MDGNSDAILKKLTDAGMEVRIPTNIGAGGCAVVISQPGHGIVATGHGTALFDALTSAMKDMP